MNGMGRKRGNEMKAKPLYIKFPINYDTPPENLGLFFFFFWEE